jgi:hypothetical protein
MVGGVNVTAVSARPPLNNRTDECHDHQSQFHHEKVRPDSLHSIDGNLSPCLCPASATTRPERNHRGDRPQFPDTSDSRKRRFGRVDTGLERQNPLRRRKPNRRPGQIDPTATCNDLVPHPFLRGTICHQDRHRGRCKLFCEKLREGGEMTASEGPISTRPRGDCRYTPGKANPF